MTDISKLLIVPTGVIAGSIVYKFSNDIVRHYYLKTETLPNKFSSFLNSGMVIGGIFSTSVFLNNYTDILKKSSLKLKKNSE